MGAQFSIGEMLTLFEGGFKERFGLWVGVEFVKVKEVVVVGPELRTQEVQAVEFGKQVRGGVRDGAQWVRRRFALVFRERFMGVVELEIVHLAVTLIEKGCAAEGSGRQQNDGC